MFLGLSSAELLSKQLSCVLPAREPVQVDSTKRERERRFYLSILLPSNSISLIHRDITLPPALTASPLPPQASLIRFGAANATTLAMECKQLSETNTHRHARERSNTARTDTLHTDTGTARTQHSSTWRFTHSHVRILTF